MRRVIPMKKLIAYLKNNKKQSIIIGLASVTLILLFVIGMCLLSGKSRSVTIKATATKGELEQEITVQKDSTQEVTTESETTVLQGTDEAMNSVSETTSDENAQASENPDVNEQLSQTTSINSSVGADIGALRVAGTHLVDGNGNIIQLRGISTHGIAWYPDYINRACFKQLHEEFGVNVIRLAMYTAEYNGYCTGGDKHYLKELINNGVQCATENNMYVIIDWHILSDSNPNTHIEDAKAFFDEMSSKYASYTNVIYEICNEPNGGTSWNEVKNYAVQVIDVIRRNDKDGIIIVGTPDWCQSVEHAAAEPITGYDNILYALHFYAATHTDSLRSAMISAVNSGLPIFVSEFGICDASGNGSIDEEQSGKWISLLNQYGISYVMWNLSNKNESSAMLQSSCNKISSFSVNDLSASGKWFLKLMTGNLNLTPYDSGSTGADGQATGKAIVQAEAKLVNTWEDGSQAHNKFYQYEITVTNGSGKACNSWSTDIRFAGDIEISDKWNGTFCVNGSTLHIESEDYNGVLGVGESIGNIGVIISGNGNLK